MSHSPRRNVTVHKPAERTDVEVRIDGRGWVTGEVRMQWQGVDDAWWCEVQFRSPAHNSTMIDSFPAGSGGGRVGTRP